VRFSSANHASQAGAGCDEVVFPLGNAAAECGVLGGGLLEPVGQLVVVLREFVDAGGQVLAADGIELLSEVTAQGCAEPVAFFAKRDDLLAGEFQVRGVLHVRQAPLECLGPEEHSVPKTSILT
jgi:hypothetical protein